MDFNIMYQDFFKFTTLPFSLTPNPHFFCQLKGHQEALNTLEFCINSGEGFIKIIGEVGSGKPFLCRKMLETLGEHYVSTYIPNPDLTPLEIRKAFARELGLNPTQWQDQHELLTAIYQHLIELHRQNKKVILIIDEAQALSDESLETIRLLTNLETENTKLLQVALFAQPELDQRLSQEKFRQLKQRISFSYSLPLMNREDLETYLHHRLATAGHTHGNLFTKKAKKLLFNASKGIPRIVNILSHKALLVAYGQGEQQINHRAMKIAIKDTEITQQFKKRRLIKLTFITSMIIAGIALMIYLAGVIGP